VEVFDFQLRTRLIYGVGEIERLGTLARELGARKVLLVTDTGLVRAGHALRAERILVDAGSQVRVFDGTRENPTTQDVETCLDYVGVELPDLIVGIGGGSSIDTAKGTNLLLTNGGRMEDYWGLNKATKPMLPLIAVPTTAGTGTEVQSFALIARAADRQKMACGDPKVAPRIALLDPELTLSQPVEVTACTGLDAIGHGVETAVSTKRSPVSSMFSREAFRLASASFERVLAAPEDLQARGGMLRAASFAGLAIETSMLGAAHSCANPLTARYGMQHGHAVGLMLPHVVRFNAAEPQAAREYEHLAASAGLRSEVEALIERIEELLAATSLPTVLSECGVPRDAIEDLAAEAAKQWTAQFNPRSVGSEDFAQLFSQALGRGAAV